LDGKADYFDRGEDSGRFQRFKVVLRMLVQLPFSAYIYREKRKSTLKKKNSLNVYAPIHNITP